MGAVLVMEAATEGVPAPSTDPSELLTDLDTYLIGALDIAEQLQKLRPSRELALVYTKLEEAQLWGCKIERDEGEGVTR